MVRIQKTSEGATGGESKKVSKPGTYHVLVADGHDGVSTQGKPINGFSATLIVVAGTEKDQKDKEFHLHLFDPDMSKSETAQEMSIKKQTAYGIAVNQIDPNKLGEEVECDFDSDAVKGHQFMIVLAPDTRDASNLQLDYDKIFHIDDPRMAKMPKDAEALKSIPSEFRKKPEFFSSIAKKEMTGKPAANKPKISDSDVEDL